MISILYFINLYTHSQHIIIFYFTSNGSVLHFVVFPCAFRCSSSPVFILFFFFFASYPLYLFDVFFFPIVYLVLYFIYICTPVSSEYLQVPTTYFIQTSGKTLRLSRRRQRRSQTHGILCTPSYIYSHRSICIL